MDRKVEYVSEPCGCTVAIIVVRGAGLWPPANEITIRQRIGVDQDCPDHDMVIVRCDLTGKSS